MDDETHGPFFGSDDNLPTGYYGGAFLPPPPFAWLQAPRPIGYFNTITQTPEVRKTRGIAWARLGINPKGDYGQGTKPTQGDAYKVVYERMFPAQNVTLTFLGYLRAEGTVWHITSGKQYDGSVYADHFNDTDEEGEPYAGRAPIWFGTTVSRATALEYLSRHVGDRSPDRQVHFLQDLSQLTGYGIVDVYSMQIAPNWNM